MTVNSLWGDNNGEEYVEEDEIFEGLLSAVAQTNNGALKALKESYYEGINFKQKEALSNKAARKQKEALQIVKDEIVYVDKAMKHYVFQHLVDLDVPGTFKFIINNIELIPRYNRADTIVRALKSTPKYAYELGIDEITENITNDYDIIRIEEAIDIAKMHIMQQPIPLTL